MRCCNVQRRSYGLNSTTRTETSRHETSRRQDKEDQNFNFHICENIKFIWVWNLVSHTEGETQTENDENIWAAEDEVRGD
jgi:hypothetical protein